MASKLNLHRLINPVDQDSLGALRRQNAQAAVHRFPNEIISDILVYAIIVSQNEENPFQRGALSQKIRVACMLVCTAWRDLIVATPQAWATLPPVNGVVSLRRICLCLERSKNADLNIALSDPGNHDGKQRNLQRALDVTIPYFDNCSTLSVTVRTRPLVSFFPLPRPMARLRNLGLIYPGFKLPQGVSLVDKNSECALRVLVIWAPNLPGSLFDHLNTQFITDLHLTSVTGIPRCVLEIINNSPFLQNLSLGEERPSSGDDDNESESVSMTVHTPRLVTLCISGCTLLPHLKGWAAPRLLELRLSPGPRPFVFGPDDAFQFPALRALTVGQIDPYDENLHILHKILRNHPSLATLHIPCDASLYNSVFNPLLVSSVAPDLRTLRLVARNHGYTDALIYLRRILVSRPDMHVILTNGGKVPREFWPGRAAIKLELEFPERVSIKA